MKRSMWIVLGLAMSLALFCREDLAQGTAFPYQGRLTDGGTPATANYDFQFTLWDADSGGSQQPQPSPVTVTRSNVVVSNGTFPVQLDFGARAFPGADRLLEIGGRPAGSGSFTILAPRQSIGSTPYAIHTLNATTADNANNAIQLGGVEAGQYVLTGDSRLTDARPPTAGSSNYIQNSTNQQVSSNFNISGTGKANFFNSATSYGLRTNIVVLSAPGDGNLLVGFGAGAANTGTHNVYVGEGAGQGSSSTASGNSFLGYHAGQFITSGSGNSFFGDSAGFSNTTGANNSFFGQAAGQANTTGFNNSFFGQAAGNHNTTGNLNSFFGQGAGLFNTTGGRNSFFGGDAGVLNTTGANNSFFGQEAGDSNTAGANNSCFGAQSGKQNTTGGSNSFFGDEAGELNGTGTNNTAIGFRADVESGDLNNATAIGARAFVSQSNSLVLGSMSGVNGCTADNVCADTNVGIGTTAPHAKLHISGTGTLRVRIDSDTNAGLGLGPGGQSKWSV